MQRILAGHHLDPIMKKVNLNQAFDSISQYWTPFVAAELNGQHVKLARIKGEFVWHYHAEADELFYVVKGTLTLRLRDQDIILGPGEFFVVPAGVEHQPVAEDEVLLMLFEPAGTLNTGNVTNDLTVDQPDHL